MKRLKILFTLSLAFCFNSQPKDFIEFGRDLESKGRLEEAWRSYQAVLVNDKNNKDAHICSGRVLEQQKKYKEALTEYQIANKLEPDNKSVLLSMGNLQYIQGDVNGAIETFEKMLEINPTCLSALGNIGRAQMSCLQYNKAKAIYERFIALCPDDPLAQFHMALIELTLGDYEKGLPRFDTWRRILNGLHKRNYPCPELDLDILPVLNGKTVFIYFDQQGFGDIFQYVRYVQELKERGAYIIIEAPKSLSNLLSQYSYIDAIVKPGDYVSSFDFHACIGDLPGIFKTTLDTIPQKIPYIFADEKLVKKWAEILDKDTDFKVGLCWSGGESSEIDFQEIMLKKRSIPIELFSQLSGLKNVSFYSLQKEQQEDFFVGDTLIKGFGDDFDKSHGAFMDTAAVMKNLDLVITTDTSVAHLAGGLGVPTLLLLSYEPNWRWMVNRADSPWYPPMRLFRQSEPGGWSGVIEEVKNNLYCLKEKKGKPRTIVNANEEIDFIKQLVSDKKFDLAEEEAKNALEVFPDNLGILFEYAYLLLFRDDFLHADQVFEKIFEQRPNSSAVIVAMAYSKSLQHDYGGAIDIMKCAISNDKDNKSFNVALRNLYMQIGRLDLAMQIREAEFNKENVVIPYLPDNFSGKTVLFTSGGACLGDVFLWVRYAKEMKKRGASFVGVELENSVLRNILSLCPYIDKVFNKKDCANGFDRRISMLSSLCLFRTIIETIPCDMPYLYSDSSLQNDWQKKLSKDSNFKVGICCESGSDQYVSCSSLMYSMFKKRDMSLSFLQSLGDIKGISFYSLQKDFQDSVNVGKFRLNGFGSDFDKNHGAFMDTAAVMKNLDLVITVDTAVAHLAGGLGVPTWVLLPYNSEGRWMVDRTDSPWYPTMRLFRQSEPGGWSGVIEEVKKELDYLTIDKEI
ncbi:tetratricopeptide repeat protein [bacterium]|jgi:tetratricopeptide (TPR) repeat protein|nr:tetratricopeptide repeat protein [bacterium]